MEANQLLDPIIISYFHPITYTFSCLTYSAILKFLKNMEGDSSSSLIIYYYNIIIILFDRKLEKE